jgi:hypothetical protein
MVRPVNVEGGELQFLTTDSKDAHTQYTLLAQKLPISRIHSFRGGELEFLTADSKNAHTKDTLFANKFPISKQNLNCNNFYCIIWSGQ